MLPRIPSERLRLANDRPADASRAYVLYWMIAARRSSWNYALDRALDWGEELKRPIVVFEALRADYPFASDRLHAFVLAGMRDNAAAFAQPGIAYLPYVEPRADAGKGLLAALASHACVVVADEFPCSFLPKMVAAAGARIDARLEVVDSNGLLPIRAAARAYPSAASFRRVVQRLLPVHLVAAPRASPFAGRQLPRAPALRAVRERWPAATARVLAGATTGDLPIDHRVAPVQGAGGSGAARRILADFVGSRVTAYDRQQRHPDLDGTSRLSPYLHFGHLSIHEAFDAVTRRERWSLRRRARTATGAREGWWGLSRGAEAFLDHLVVWRELSFNTCTYRPEDYRAYDALPAWALTTLEAHAADRRPFLYSREAFEQAATHDPLWNAAQRQLLREGWMHNYMRMLWGKKILEWSAHPREALSTMAEIMDRWALDGRDPNSYAGYCWTLGRYDRPWPERSVFGKVRAMSSASTARKVRVRGYLQRYGEHS